MRQKIEVRLAKVLFARKSFREAIEVVNPLLIEARKIDDK